MSETVYVASNAGTNHIYHTDKHCTHLKDKRREWDKEDAEKMNYELCDFCRGELSYDFSGREKSLRQKIEDGEVSL